MTDAVLAAAHEAIQKGSKSFALASRLFDGGTRDRATLLYAWCRHCDDVIDDQMLGEGAHEWGDWGATPAERLARFLDRVHAAYRADPELPLLCLDPGFAEELRAEWIEGKTRIGLTAGASAPDILVQQVIERLRALGALSVRKLDGVEETIKFPLPKGLKLDTAGESSLGHLS